MDQVSKKCRRCGVEAIQTIWRDDLHLPPKVHLITCSSCGEDDVALIGDFNV